MSVPAGERRIVSVLVADVAGSTTIAEALGPERSKFLFDDVARLMSDEVDAAGGTVAQLTGDGLLALFGLPVAHEDDSERAVRAAVAIRDRVLRYGEEVGIELRSRVAVNTGPVVVPARDAPPHELYNALGDTVNVAARLQTFGELVVGPDTAAQVAAAVELEPLGPLELKGRAETVDAFRVLGARSESLVRPEPPLVGRAEELAALGEALEELLSGRGGIVSITGEPGIGKSRLVREASGASGERIRFLQAGAAASTETIPYWPVRSLLRAWLGLGVSDPEARVRLELRAALARTLPDDGDAYPLVGTLLGLTLEPELERRIRELASDAVRQQTFDCLYGLISAIARRRPLCVVLDDLHWADEATLSLVDELLPVVEEADVLFVLIHRSDPDHEAWRVLDRARRRFPARYRELALGPLAEADGRRLADEEADGELPDELARRLLERAGGNPYFVVEAVRDLRERGSLTSESSIPGALQEALQARLDRLDPDARTVLTTAAVIGQNFGLDLLERVLPGARLRPTLSELQWLELVDEERRGLVREYRFRHGLVQEVAYGSLVAVRRRELHRQVGEALLELHRDSPAEVVGLLAHHFAEAEDAERAVEFLLRAGDAARTAAANDEAITLYRRALTFMERTGDDDGARRILLRIGLSHHLAFDFGAAGEAFAEAFARPEPRAQRLEPTERVVWAMTAAWDRVVVPSHSLTKPAAEIGSNVMRGLLWLGREYELEPDLAESFTVSRDGRSYRFTIRPGACWSDGEPVTAFDFELAFTRIVEDGLVAAFWLDGITASALDERTLALELAEPRSYLLYVLAVPPLVAWPRHVYERRGSDWHRDVPLVGNGPFVLTSLTDGGAVLEAAPTWTGPRGNVREVRIELQAARATAAERWRQGEYDVVDDSLMYDGLTGDDGTLERSPGMQTWYVGFVARQAPCDDTRLRLAVAHAVDRTRAAATLGAVPAASGGFIPPAMPGHSHRVAPVFDPERARALLREAGAGRLELQLACLDLWQETALEIASQLEPVGIRVRVLVAASDSELTDAVEGLAHLFVWAWSADVPDPGGGLLEPILDAGVLYRDGEIDELLARARSLRDRDERLRTYRELERVWIGERAALVPLAYTDRLLWRRPWVTGLWANAVGMSTFQQVVMRRD